jgi:hypothetical protein
MVPLLSPMLLAGLPPQWRLFAILGLLPILVMSFILLTRSHSSSSTKGSRLLPAPVPTSILGGLHQLSALPQRSLHELASAVVDSNRWLWRPWRTRTSPYPLLAR